MASCQLPQVAQLVSALRFAIFGARLARLDVSEVAQILKLNKDKALSRSIRRAAANSEKTERNRLKDAPTDY